MNELAVRGSTDLSLSDGQTFFSDKQIAALRQMGVKDATNGDLAVFFHHCARTGLDPFAKQIYMIGRWSREGTKQTIQVGIDGFRLVARRACDRTGESLGYEDTLWCGEDGQWTEVWTSSEPPVAAKVVVLRGGLRYPAVAHWNEYVQTNKDGTPNSMWARMRANQLAKCAEALALRKACPQDLSGIYTDDEIPVERPQNHRRPPGEALREAAGLTPAPEPEVVDADPSDVTDAEVVPDVPMISRPQSQKMHALFNEKGFKDRDDALAYVATVVDREVSTTNDLTRDDASKVIESLVALDAAS